MRTEAAVNVAIAEHEVLVREGVHRILERAGCTVVAAVGDVPSLREALLEHGPDVVVTDAMLPPSFTEEGVRMAEELRRGAPSIGVLLLTSRVDPVIAGTLFGKGATGRGYALKQGIDEGEKLVEAVRTVAEGGLYLDVGLVGELLGTDDDGHSRALAALTPRESQILAMMAEGRSNAGIAGQLEVTSRAVERHVGSIFAKLSLRDTPEVSRRVLAVRSYLDDADRRLSAD